MIEKYVQADWKIEAIFDSPIKVANWQPEVYVPPEISEFVRNLKPDPSKFAYVHLIAMSDGDSYGSNMNGDIFTADQLTGTQTPEEAAKNPDSMQGICLPRYKTFEQAKFYKHHANGPMDPHYGDVPLAVWNDLMRRVELIVRIAKQPIPELGMNNGMDVVVKLDRRGYLTVSMGTRISHERCRYCGAENEFIHQRCDHLKNHINEIMPDGRQVTAENFGCRFFDLSDVTIPADPIAYTLNKVASAVQSTTPNPAFDVEQYGPWSAKLSEMEKRDVGGSTPVVRDTEYTRDCPYCGSADTVPEFSDRELKEAAANATDLDSVLATATVAGIVFSPRELAFLTDHFEPGKAADFHGFGAIALDKFSPFVYHALRSKLAERSGYLAPCLRSGWEPTKIAEQGFDAVAKYYTYYRASLGSLPRSTFTKAAHHLVPELLGDGDVTRSTRVQGALYHLAYAGMSV